MPIKALVLAGGGVRGLATVGAVMRGVYEKAINLAEFDVVTGDSFGALVAAMITNGYQMEEISEALTSVDIAKLVSFIPWSLRRLTIPVHPLKLKGIARFIDEDLNLKPNSRLIFNTWDCLTDNEIVYTSDTPPWLKASIYTRPVFKHTGTDKVSLGTLLTRSMALPGLEADDTRYMDGGIGQHPPLDILPSDASIVFIDLGYAGLIPTQGIKKPVGVLNRAMYAYEVAASLNQKRALSRFTDLTIIDPKVYDVDSTNFGLSKDQREALVIRAFSSTETAWKEYLIKHPHP